MKKLVANYKIKLETPIIVKRSDKNNPHYEFEVNGFSITLEMTATRSTLSKKNRERHWTVPFTHFVLTVARPDSPPPEVIPKENGGMDYTIQSEYFSKRTPIFGNIAAQVINNAIRYFKYRLWQPLLHEIEENNNSLVNPAWTDEQGKEVGKGPGLIVVKPIPGMDRQDFGTIKFEKKHDALLMKALRDTIQPSLKDEIIYDAQSAIYSDNYRRVVLEMALSTEICVKQLLFGTASPGGLVFEYLEDKGKVNVRVIDLIDKVALQVFGSSFKITNPDDYENIDHLFRCRNKVAHRGEATFKDDAGKLHQVDLKKIKEWWKSYEKLNAWLDKLK